MRFWKKMISRAAFAGVLSLAIVLSVLVPVGHHTFAEEGGVSDLSLYQRASELTREFATALSPGSGVEEMYMLEKTTDDDLLVAGNAGALLGYAEVLSDDTGIVGWLMNSYTAASATITYDQLMHVIDNGGDSVYDAGQHNPFFQYAGYGEVLTEMGMISTVRPGFGELMRLVGSGTMLLVYLLANAAPFLFRGALMILTTLNPFRLFETVMEGTASADLGVISGIAEYVGSMYETVQNFSIVFLFPAMLAITAFSVLVFRKGSAMKRFSRYGVRVFMLFAGLPLIGATYTGLIEDLDSKVSVGSEYADYLVLSSYVDFENWVKYSRLAPPTETTIRNPRYGEDEERTLSNRELILEINGTRANNTRAAALKSRYSATSDIGEIFEEGGDMSDADSGSMSQTEKKSFTKVYSLLSRHMTNAKYTGSDYDGEVSGQIQKIRTQDSGSESDENDENIVKMFALSASDNRTWSDKLNVFSDDPEWMKPIHWNGEEGKGSESGDDKTNSAKGLFTEGRALNDVFKFGKYRMNIYNSGDLRYTIEDGYVAPEMDDMVTSKTAPIGENRDETVGGLSPIAMYNFLNTTFSNTGLTVYSPSKTASDNSRDSYAAVTFGGSGISAFTRWIENVTVMLCLAILSIAYGVMMISAAIKNIPRILTGVFGTAFGSIAFVTKLLISTAVLIIQVVGMIFLYSLSENIIMTLLLNFNQLVDTGGSYFGTGLIFDFLGSFMITAITATVTVFMIKNMKVFKELMEEVVTNAINRVMGALDTSTGGQGLDVSKTSGGRVGGDGKLSDGARNADGSGLTGAMEGFASGSPIRSAAGLLGDAHGIESRREQMEQELEKPESGLGTKISNRIGTAKDLMGARGKDVAKGFVGVEGQSLAREMDAKDRKLNSMFYNKDDGDDGSQEGGSEETATTHMGQAVDENGEIVKDAQGNALDAEGNQISSVPPVGMAGKRAMTGEDGSLLDADGNTYTDELGQSFHQNDKGQLVDSDGNFVALDKDGTLQPIAAIPGHSGRPASASKEAKKLDNMRFNADAYDEMRNEQGASHYGLDKEGNVVGTNGEALQAKGSPVGLDSQGFMTDANGNRVSASDVNGSVDQRGFEEVEDAETGETHLKHKGDEAMKNAVLPPGASGKSGNQNLTSLAKQSNRASANAKRADERVEELKANGASSYAVMQAQRYADKANKNARASQQTFNQAMQDHAKGKPAAGAARQPVTEDHVQSATRHASAEQSALDESVGKLEQMKADGAPSKMIARQERKVDAQRQSANQAATMEQDLRTAKSANRSYNEVHDARSRVESAEQLYQKAQDDHAQAVASNQPKEVIQKREEKMNQASNVLASAQTNMTRASQKPSGTPEQIDQASARYEQAEARHGQAKEKVQRLEQQSDASHPYVQTAKQEQKQAQSRYNQAQNNVRELRQNGAPETEIQAAKQEQQQAKSDMEQASGRAQKLQQQQTKVQSAKQEQQQAQTRYQQAQATVRELEQNGAPEQDVQEAKKEQRRAHSQHRQASGRVDQLQERQQEQHMQTAKWAQSKAENRYQQATNAVQQLEDKGAPEQEIQAAKGKQRQAQRQVQQASGHVTHLEQRQADMTDAKREQHQARVQHKRAKHKVQELEQNEAPERDIQQAKRAQKQAKTKHENATSRVESLKQPSQQPSESQVRTARKEEQQAKRQMNKAQTAKQRTLNPSGWSGNGQSVPQVREVPARSQDKSYAELTSAGVSSYDDYSKQVKTHSSNLKNNRSKLQQAEQRLATLRSSNRPPQIIEQAENKVKGLQQSVQNSEANVKKLKDNAQGLLKNGSFQPTVASRPIRKHGSALINQMVHMSQTQAMYDKLAHQEKAGTITQSGSKQMKKLGGRLGYMKRDLVRSGIREDAIKDNAGILQTTKQMQQSWDSFVNGTTIENTEG